MGKSVLENSAWLLIEKFVAAGSVLLVTPYIIKMVGAQQWAIWVLFNSFGSYFALGQFGLNVAFNKYIAEFRAKRDDHKVRCLVFTGLVALSAIAVVLFLAGAVLAPVFLSTLVKDSAASEYLDLFVWFLLVVCLGIATQVYISVPRGYQRYDITAQILVATRLTNIGVVLLLLHRGLQLRALFLAFLAASVTTTTLHILAAVVLLRGAHLRSRYFDTALIRRLFGFGVRLQVSYVASWVSQNFDKVILARGLGLAYVTIYDIGARLVMLMREVPLVFFEALVPRASELHVGGDLAQLNRLYVKGVRYTMVMAAMVVAAVVPVSQLVLSLWLRATPDPQSVYTFNVLLVSAMGNLFTGVGSSIGKGMDQPGYEARANGVTAIVNVLLSVLLLRFYGYRGVVWGTALAYMTGAGLLLWYINRLLNFVSLPFAVRNMSLPVLACAGAVMLGTTVTVPSLLARFGTIASTSIGQALIIGLHGAAASLFLGAIFVFTGFTPLGEVVDRLRSVRARNDRSSSTSRT